jgi:acyl carrier protein
MDKEQQIREKLNVIFRNIFDDETLQIYDTMSAADVENWDSLTHINLIVAIEKGFKISMTTKEVQALSNVGELVRLVVRKLP